MAYIFAAMDTPASPSHLSSSARKWWAIVTSRYELEEHHLRLLQLACEAWDQAQDARYRLSEEGLTIGSAEDGTLRTHPCVKIEHDSAIRFARLVRELDLDLEPPPDERFGPPSIPSNRSRRHARKASDA
jgi:P27 family predicted phage terminase small subunit